MKVPLLIHADFDPEADVLVEGSEGSDSEASDDGLTGTEHYGEIRYAIYFCLLGVI